VRRFLRIATALVVLSVLSVMLFAQQDDRAVRQAKNNRARAFWKRADGQRLRKKHEEARKDYEQAASLWDELGNRNFAAVTRLMVDLCGKIEAIDVRKLKDGDYQGTARGYSADITVAVRIKNGKITGFAVPAQKESRPLKSLEILPNLVKRRQSPSVDAVSGATVTSYGVMAATLQALEKAKPDDAAE